MVEQGVMRTYIRCRVATTGEWGTLGSSPLSQPSVLAVCITLIFLLRHFASLSTRMREVGKASIIFSPVTSASFY
ncbi:hypothetical protein HDV57DRAFT_457029 [Trichoderma longibrachiatum]|uniref:Uncharacterized protein n=1 Tax=Trichoderma longibrachiatum ATCC 18648 TaxID=983965 RepID=A0A2T4C506_TRILO|nr:hypothetical protein M440DRAFT_299478 [Trichoderma longibrachiatum ATCC 18648]